MSMTDNQGDIPSSGRGGGGWLPWLQEHIEELLYTLGTARDERHDVLEIEFYARSDENLERGVLNFIRTWLEATVRQEDDLLFYYPLSTGESGKHRWFLVWRKDNG